MNAVRAALNKDTKIILSGSKPTFAWAALRAAHGEIGRRPLSCVLVRRVGVGSNHVRDSLITYRTFQASYLSNF